MFASNLYNSKRKLGEINFKEKHTFNNRMKESRNIISKYPERVPVIVEKQAMSDVMDIDKNKFLVPCDLTVGQFVYVIRKRMKCPQKRQYLFSWIIKYQHSLA